MIEDKRPLTVNDLELEALKRAFHDPRLPERGIVSPSERVLKVQELISEHIKKVSDEYNRGVWKG